MTFTLHTDNEAPDSVRITWNHPHPHEWFYLYHRPDGGTWRRTDLPGILTTHTLTGLTPGTEYEMTLTGQVGDSPSTPPSNARTAKVTPGAKPAPQAKAKPEPAQEDTEAPPAKRPRRTRSTR